MSGEHTPTPWEVDGTYLMATDADGRLLTVADCARSWGSSIPIGKANAAFIGVAVNSHDALLEALRELLAHASFGGIAPHYEDMARAAIAKAEGRS